MAPKRSPPALSDKAVSSLKTFIDIQGEESPTLKVSCPDFRNAFNAWRDGKPVNHGLAEAMRVLGFFMRRVKHGTDDKQTGVYFGIGLKDVTSEEAKEAQPLVDTPDKEAQDEVPREVEPEDLALVLSGEDYGKFSGFRVRKTGSPPLVSIIDLIKAVQRR
jgi:hypothetical protein